MLMTRDEFTKVVYSRCKRFVDMVESAGKNTDMTMDEFYNDAFSLIDMLKMDRDAQMKAEIEAEKVAEAQEQEEAE